jgi:hypothetical protein
MILKQSTAYNRTFGLFTAAGVGVTGATVTVNLSQAGGAFFVPAGTVTQIGLGYYFIPLTTGDTGTPGELAWQITSTGGSGTSVPTNFVDQVQVRIFPDLSLTASGLAAITSNVKINQNLPGYQFMMTNAVTNAPMTGLGGAIVATRSLGGAGFSPCANVPFEVGSGVYAINLVAADLNNASVALRFTAAGANDNVIVIVTQP